MAAELILGSGGNDSLEAAHVLTVLADLAELSIALPIIIELFVDVFEVTLDWLLRLLVPVCVDEHIFICFFDLTEI